jgi:hypothetical protein
MPKTTKQLTQPELQPQPPHMPSTRMETKKSKSPQRLWLLTGVLVLLFIVLVAAASQASKSSQSTKTTAQAAQTSSYHANYPGGAGPQPSAMKCVPPQVRPGTPGVTTLHTWCPPLGYHANYPGGAGPQHGATQSLPTY